MCHWLEWNSQNSYWMSLKKHFLGDISQEQVTDFVIETLSEIVAVFIVGYRTMFQMIVDFFDFEQARFIETLK